MRADKKTVDQFFSTEDIADDALHASIRFYDSRDAVLLALGNLYMNNKILLTKEECV